MQNLSDEQFEEYVRGLDDNIESVTTCLATSETEGKQHGLVLTVKGVDVVLLASDLQNIIEHLDQQVMYEDDDE